MKHNVYVCLSVCNTITLESLDVGSVFLVCAYNSNGYRSHSYMKVIGQGQGHRSKRRENLVAHG